MANKKIRYSVIYNYERTGNLNYDGTAVVYVRAYLNGKNKFFNTGVSIAPNQWKGGTADLIKNHPNATYLNESIREMLNKMQVFEYEVSRAGGSLTLDQLSDYETENYNISFTDFCWEQLELSKSSISKDSFTDQRQTLFKLKDFKEKIYFSNLNFGLINSFDKYLFGLELGTNTVAKHHKNLKKFINLSIKLDYLDINKNPYKKFKVKREPTERIFLTEHELLKVEKLSFTQEQDGLKMVRDFFLFMSWTGLRYSDASKVIANDFVETAQGMELYFKAKKTKKTLNLNLRKLFNGKPEQLIKSYLEKYDDFYFNDPDNPIPIFFGLTNQYINRELKGLVSQLKIRSIVKEKISCHSARHSFGCIMAGKIKVQVLQKLMQHSKLKETMIYVHLNQSMINNELDKIEW